MRRFARPLSLRRHPAWLLALGLLAVALHVMAGTGLMRAAPSVGGDGTFVAELCTSHGGQGALPRVPGGSSSPASGTHDCCKLCAASSPLLAAASIPAVPPAPTFASAPALPAFVRVTPDIRSAHHPRGPPAIA